MRKVLIIIITLFFSGISKGQDISDLPVVPYPAKVNDPQKPLVIYLSGDGGENSFSKSLLQQVNDKGYAAVLFNSQKYFWSKKTPEQTASDVEKVITYYRTQWKAQRIIILGYSFGADVAPFVATRLSKDTYASVKDIVLLSPSNATDFEVHVSQLFGKSKSVGRSVPDEINRIIQKPLLIIQGEDETEKIEPKMLKVSNRLITLKGGHRYDRNTSEVINAIFNNL